MGVGLKTNPGKRCAHLRRALRFTYTSLTLADFDSIARRYRDTFTAIVCANSPVLAFKVMQLTTLVFFYIFYFKRLKRVKALAEKISSPLFRLLVSLFG